MKYAFNKETDKYELDFTKEQYKALPAEPQSWVKRYFNFAPSRGVWAAKAKGRVGYIPQRLNQYGFTYVGEVGERLSYAEEREQKVKRAGERADRYEGRSDSLANKAADLQAPFSEAAKDWSWVTQPIIAGHAGSARFARSRERLRRKFEEGIHTYRKSEYYRKEAERLRAVSGDKDLQNKSYIYRRIQECEKELRSIQRYMVQAEENANETWYDQLAEKYEYNMDKLSFFLNAMDALGGVQYSQDNIKVGYWVKCSGTDKTFEVIKANPKTFEGRVLTDGANGFVLKFTYAEITAVKVPDNWVDPKLNPVNQTNPFQKGDLVALWNIGGTAIIRAFEVTGLTPKMVEIRELNLDANRLPIRGSYRGAAVKRKFVFGETPNQVKVNHGDHYLYKLPV